MFFFREEEKKTLSQFAESSSDKAMAVYGRRRTGKTRLMMDFLDSLEPRRCIYYQCTSYDYAACLKDFIEVVLPLDPASSLLRRMTSFREVFQYLRTTGISGKIFILDEFPFLAKRNENAAVEFQWIIDHGLSGNKLILLGSSLSFMKRQIGDREAPLYGRFQRIIELMPFSFSEVNQLFPDFEDAVAVYARTGGVALYVMEYMKYPSVEEGDKALFFHPHGILFQEAENLLMQEVREVSTYVSILRAIGTGEKDSGFIAEKCGMDPRAVFGYLNKLKELNIISLVENPLVKKQKANRYMVSDLLFRFHYTFIEPHISMITVIRHEAMKYILDEQYREYLGFVYEMIIKNQCFLYALQERIPFMPEVVGKWWGSVQTEGVWMESEIDVAAYNDQKMILGECKYRTKAMGMKEYELLKHKSQFVQTSGRQVYYLLASRNGFTEELLSHKDDNLILIDQI